MLEAYSVAVRVSLINGVTGGLLSMSRQFAKVHGDATALQAKLDKIKLTAMAGAAMAGVGFLGLKLIFKDTLPYAKEYAHQLALMNTLGMKHAEIAKVTKDAWMASYAVPTTTAAQNLASFRELRSAFGSDAQGQAHASAMLPVVGRIQGILQSLTGKAQDHVGFDMVKAIELRTGVMTTAALQRNADLMGQALMGMGGTLSVSDFHATLKRGGIATNKWSDEFVYKYLPTLMQEMKVRGGGGGGSGGAQSAGTALMSLYQQMHGRMTKAAMPLWVQAGLVNQRDIVSNATGQYQVRPGAVKGTSTFEANPFQWVQQYLTPAVARLMSTRHISAETAINSMFSNRNAANAAYNMYFKAAQYERDKVTIGKADRPYQAYQKLLKTDPNLASQALHSQWQNILAQIGYSIMPTLIRGTLMFVKGLQALSGWMREHPTKLKVLVAGFVALSGAMAFGGTLIMLSAAFAGLGLLMPALGVAAGAVGAGIALLLSPFALTALAITAVGAALIWGVTHWDKVKSVVGGFFDWIWTKVKWIADHLPHLDLPKTSGGYTASFDEGGSSFTPKGSAGQGPMVGNVHMDGKKVGQVVWGHMNTAMGSPGAVSIGGFDPGMGMAPAGLRYR